MHFFFLAWRRPFNFLTSTFLANVLSSRSCSKTILSHSRTILSHFKTYKPTCQGLFFSKFFVKHSLQPHTFIYFIHGLFTMYIHTIAKTTWCSNKISHMKALRGINVASNPNGLYDGSPNAYSQTISDATQYAKHSSFKLLSIVSLPTTNPTQ